MFDFIMLVYNFSGLADLISIYRVIKKSLCT
jgi:hypothetical protein